MTIPEYEAVLKQIDPKFEILQHPRNPSLGGVYYDRNEANQTGFVVTIPWGEIREDFDPKYRDMETQHPHNWASKVTYVCKQHLQRLEDDPEYKKLFYEKLPTR